MNRGQDIVKGQWNRIAIRLKINDGDQSNGILEVYNNGVLAFQQTDAKVVNSIHPDYLIEHIYLNSFFGGTGPQYASPQDQFMEFDNLVAFYYPKGSSGYRSGASEKGRILAVPSVISYHAIPPNKFTPKTYTDANGTISSHCAFYQPVRHVGFETSTIQVSNASGLTINVTKFLPDGALTNSGSKQILNIYKGVGSNKTLVATYSGLGVQLQSHYISGNSATIEWQAGLGINGGFALNYTSDGSGSGNNFICDNYFANQSGFEKPQKPAAPSSLQTTNVTTTSITLKWTDNSTIETGFELERLDSKGNIENSITLGANVTTYNDVDLYSNTQYQYKVRAYNESEYSDFSNILNPVTCRLSLQTQQVSV
jgi:hypothetical protein